MRSRRTAPCRSRSTTPSPDGTPVAYGLAKVEPTGDVHVRDIAGGQGPDGRARVDAVLRHRPGPRTPRASSTRAIPEPPKGQGARGRSAGQAIYYHRVGTPQSEDRLIYERKDLPGWIVDGSVTEDGRYLLVFICEGLGQQ